MGEIGIRVAVACLLAAIMLLFLWALTFVATRSDTTFTQQRSIDGWCATHPEKAAEREYCK